MKYLQILLILITVSACSGTKRVIDTDKRNNPTSKTETINTDTINNSTSKIIKITDSLYVPQDRNNIKIKDLPIKEHIIIQDTSHKTFNHKIFNQLLQKHVSEKGDVDYLGFKTDYKKLRSYIFELGKNTPQNDWLKEEKLVYWINAYNAFTIDLILRNYPLNSIKDIKDPWGQRLWKLDKKWYNLNEIEHQILRKMNEPRIHFAIVCASYSCPKLQNEAFTAEKLETQLTKVTSDFLNDSERNSIYKNSLELSKIFKWFKKDFEQNGTLIDFINQYSDISISQKASIRFKDYNWDLNE